MGTSDGIAGLKGLLSTSPRGCLQSGAGLACLRQSSLRRDDGGVVLRDTGQRLWTGLGVLLNERTCGGQVAAESDGDVSGTFI